MMKRWPLVGAVFACWLGVAGAPARAVPPESATMERAQREADGPKRRIIEAAKARQKAAAKAEAASPRAKGVAAAASAAPAPPQPPVASAALTADTPPAPPALPAAGQLAAPQAANPPSSSANLPAAPAFSPAPDAVREAAGPEVRPNPAVSLTIEQTVQPPAQLMQTPPSPPIATQRVAAEDAYALDLNRLVDGLKRYPTSREARALRPQGTVQLWLELDRSGQLLQAGLATSSGTPLLDGEALRSVRVGRYVPFPSGAFDGQPSRRFRVAIEYRYDGG